MMGFRYSCSMTAVLSVVLVGLVGCSSGSKQTERTERTIESETRSSETASSESTTDEASEEKADRPEISMESLIGAETTAGLPSGCPTEWSKLKGRNFKGTLFACDGFHAPKQFREPTVVVGVEEEKIRRVSLQAFYEDGEAVQEVYDAVTSKYQQQCDRTGGAGGRMVLDCREYLVDISHRDETGSLRVIYGLENWDMPH